MDSLESPVCHAKVTPIGAALLFIARLAATESGAIRVKVHRGNVPLLSRAIPAVSVQSSGVMLHDSSDHAAPSGFLTLNRTLHPDNHTSDSRLTLCFMADIYNPL